MNVHLKTILIGMLLAGMTSCSNQWEENFSSGRNLQVEVDGAIATGDWDTTTRNLVTNSIVPEDMPQSRIDIGDDYVISSYVKNRYAQQDVEAKEASTRGVPIDAASKLPSIGIAIYNSKTTTFTTGTLLWKRVQAVNQNLTGSWSIPGETVVWPIDTDQLSFLSFSPYPTNASGLEWSSDGRTLDYTVPVTVTNQPDLCLATPITNRKNEAGSGNHVIRLSLQHALTAVGIKASAHKIKIISATVKNIKTKGTLNLNSNSVSWSNISTGGNRAAAVSESVESVDIKDITKTDGHLMMIPQTLDDAAILELIFDDLSVTPTKRLTKTVRLNTLTPNKWEAGKQVFYNLQMKTQFNLILNPTSIQLDGPSGQYSTGISYTTNSPNPPTATANQGWITNIQVNAATGKITFDYSENKGSVERTAVITVTSGLTTQTVNVVQSSNAAISLGEANCYMVAPSGKPIKFPVSIANKTVNKSTGQVETETRIGTTDIVTAEPLWQTTPAAVGQPASCISSIKVIGVGSSAQLEVKPGATAGSALIAVKVGGKIRWTWHIWVTAYNPSISYNTFDGRKWMDRNLGALNNTKGDVNSGGMFYQWGRKDPFIGGISFTSGAFKQVYNAAGKTTYFSSTQVTATDNFNNALENPMLFYSASRGGHWDGYTGPWNGNNKINNKFLWSNTKTPYDPCPPGWRVPELSYFGSYSSFKYESSSRGCVHPYLGYFPLVGNRGFQDGNMGNYGNMLFCWVTNTEDEIAVGALYCHKTGAQTFMSNSESGCSVRCVEDK